MAANSGATADYINYELYEKQGTLYASSFMQYIFKNGNIARRAISLRDGEVLSQRDRLQLECNGEN